MKKEIVFDLVGLPSQHQKSAPNLPNALVHGKCQSYEELFDGLLTDEKLERDYKSIVTGYRGENIATVIQLPFMDPSPQSYNTI
eukprot:scaffold7349_cov173-Amphora_coffeaeformis.AAC.90